MVRFPIGFHKDGILFLHTDFKDFKDVGFADYAHDNALRVPPKIPTQIARPF